jgi:tetraacyldisaccharide 4'-kinase
MRRAFERLEEYAVDVIFERRGGFRAGLLRVVLLAFSTVYGAAVELRLSLFRKRWLRAAEAGVPVISVGNLTVGGTGKTPVVESLARSLQAGGRRVAILSRGYKSKKLPLLKRWAAGLKQREYAPRIVSDGRHIRLDSRMAGDEPYMLAVNLPGVIVLVDKNRVASAAYAVRVMGCDALVLDDGMQFLPLRHRIEICLIDRHAPFGTEHLLPRGTLREPPANLRRATHILVTKSSPGGDPALVARIRSYNRTAEIIECAHRPVHLEDVTTGARLPLDWLRGKHVGSLCAIAQPSSFERALADLGAKIEVSRHFADHHRFTEREVAAFVARCARRDTDAVITTEKDSVRLPRLDKLEVPVYFLRVEIEILSGQSSWDALLRRLCEPARPVAPPRLF